MFRLNFSWQTLETLIIVHKEQAIKRNLLKTELLANGCKQKKKHFLHYEKLLSLYLAFNLTNDIQILIEHWKYFKVL